MATTKTPVQSTVTYRVEMQAVQAAAEALVEALLLVPGTGDWIAAARDIAQGAALGVAVALRQEEGAAAVLSAATAPVPQETLAGDPVIYQVGHNGIPGGAIIVKTGFEDAIKAAIATLDHPQCKALKDVAVTIVAMGKTGYKPVKGTKPVKVKRGKEVSDYYVAPAATVTPPAPVPEPQPAAVVAPAAPVAETTPDAAPSEPLFRIGKTSSDVLVEGFDAAMEEAQRALDASAARVRKVKVTEVKLDKNGKPYAVKDGQTGLVERAAKPAKPSATAKAIGKLRDAFAAGDTTVLDSLYALIEELEGTDVAQAA